MNVFGKSETMNMTFRIERCLVKWFRLVVALLGGVVGFLCVTQAQDRKPASEPILRIETGTHTDKVVDMNADAAGRYLVTSSDDNTVRVWDVATGKLIRTLRVPMGKDYTEYVAGVAISPDGNTVAVGVRGGFTSYPRLYIFNTLSGTIRRAIFDEREDEHVGHVYERYSKDGRFLATQSHEYGKGPSKSGVKVYETQNYKLIAENMELGADDLDWDDTGRLVTVARSGSICIFDALTPNQASLRLLAKGQASFNNINTVEISPDGSKVIIVSRTKLEVRSGKDLTFLYAIDTSDLTSKDLLEAVSWSTDSKTLYVAVTLGFLADRRQGQLRKWTDGGRGKYQIIATEKTRITRFSCLTSEEIVYATAAPAILTLDAGGRKKIVGDSSVVDYWGMQADFLVSQDGSEVQFVFQRDDTLPVVFSIRGRKLLKQGDGRTSMHAPITQSSNLTITDWFYFFNPVLNGKKLGVDRGYSNSLAISPDQEHFLLGRGFGPTVYDKLGNKTWEVWTPQPLAVNISRNGVFAIAALKDGTIRWYRMVDGVEVLALFPHADRKRWVLWTPSGYYDASPGAEDLIGWHVNNTKDHPVDFFPVGQFRSTYYRPDVISKILETGDEERALRLANEERGRKAQTTTLAQMLPPVVEIASPADNSDVSSSEVTIRYSLRTPSGEAVTNVRALVDGRPITGNRQLTREESTTSGVRELKVSVPEHDSEVSIIAENRFAASVPATIRLKWRGTAPKADAFVIQPKLYVLAIGVSQYQNPAYSLKFADKDANDFAVAVTNQKGLLYRDVVTKVLTNEHATKDEILDGLDWIRKETTSKDVAMVFFAGHGLNDQNGVYYFLPYNTDLDKLLRTGVPFTDIKNIVQSLAGKTLFFIDTCHSGNVLGGRRGLADDLNGVINELASAESGAVVFAASTGNQYSLEDPKWNNGAFTKALVEGLMGRADYTGKGRITINMLDLYISERVKELTNGKQTPTTAKPNTVPDFPIAVRK